MSRAGFTHRPSSPPWPRTATAPASATTASTDRVFVIHGLAMRPAAASISAHGRVVDEPGIRLHVDRGGHGIEQGDSPLAADILNCSAAATVAAYRHTSIGDDAARSPGSPRTPSGWSSGKVGRPQEMLDLVQGVGSISSDPAPLPRPPRHGKPVLNGIHRIILSCFVAAVLSRLPHYMAHFVRRWRLRGSRRRRTAGPAPAHPGYLASAKRARIVRSLRPGSIRRTWPR